MELSEKALSFLKQNFGVTAEALKDLSEGNKEKVEKEVEAHTAKIKTKSREELANELENDHKAAINNERSNASIGAYNAAKNTIVDFAKKIGVTLAKADFESLDYKQTVALIVEKFSEKGSAADSNKNADTETLTKQLDEANKLLNEYKGQVDNMPKLIESAKREVLDNITIEQELERNFNAYKDKTDKHLFEKPALKTAVKELYRTNFAQKGIKFFTEEIDGKIQVVPKMQQKDRDGKPIEGKYIRVELNSTTNHSLETLTEKFFTENNLIVAQGEGYNGQNSQQQKNNNNQQPAAQKQPLPWGSVSEV